MNKTIYPSNISNLYKFKVCICIYSNNSIVYLDQKPHCYYFFSKVKITYSIHIKYRLGSEEFLFFLVKIYQYIYASASSCYLISHPRTLLYSLTSFFLPRKYRNYHKSLKSRRSHHNLSNIPAKRLTCFYCVTNVCLLFIKTIRWYTSTPLQLLTLKIF